MADDTSSTRATHSSTTRTPKCLYIFDSPRTCSQLFFKLFEKHPQLEQVFHPLMACSVYGPERLWKIFKHGQLAEDTQNAFPANAIFADETYDAGIARLTSTVARIEDKGSVALLKDHTLCTIKHSVMLNHLRDQRPIVDDKPSVLPETLLDKITPIFLIRHPALSVPSFYRQQRAVFKFGADDEDFKALTSQQWVKLIFDFFLAETRRGPQGAARASDPPIVINAADIVYNTEPLMIKLCQRLHLAPDRVQYEWEPVPTDQRPPDPILHAFFQDVWNSNGVRRLKKPAEEEIDLDALEMVWTEEWDRQTARTLRGLVEHEIPNYEYLDRFRFGTRASTLP